MPTAEQLAEPNRLGQAIRRQRRKKGWRQLDLANRLDVRQQTVARWESGDVPPQRRFHASLAEFLEVTPDRFYDLLGTEASAPIRTSNVVRIGRFGEEETGRAVDVSPLSDSAEDLMRAFIERMRSGVPLRDDEADLFKMFASAVGLVLEVAR